MKKRNFLCPLLCLLFSVIMFSGQAFAAEAYPTVQKFSEISNETYSVVTPRADRIEWRYQAFNGVLHKRQYNYTRGIWIGDWVPA